MSAVDVSDLTVVIDRPRQDPIVSRVGFSLEPGEVLGLVGESGSGKSTVALALLGYVRPGARIAGGTVSIDGVDLLGLRPSELREARRTLVAYVPQDPATALNPALRIITQLTEALPGDRAEARSRVRGLLETVGLPSDDAFLRRKPHQLSGGQQQRVAIAMAVAVRPRLIVLDEPTTGLDVTTQARVLAMVKELCRVHTLSAVYVSHDLAVVEDVADHVTVMYGGLVVESGTSPQVLRTPAHPYSRALLDAVPSAQKRLRLVPIPGRAPGVGDHARGCVFAPRCAFVAEECRHVEPALVPAPTGSCARCLRLPEVVGEPRGVAVERDRGAAGSDDPDAMLSVAGLNAGYPGHQVLFDVSLSARRGECVAVVGESGSGKTTLSRCLIGLHPSATADLRFEGRPLVLRSAGRSAEERRAIQYVFQNPFGSLNPRRTVGSSVQASLPQLLGVTRREATVRAREALERVDLPAGLFGRFPAELSGGQRQRVAIARALACDPKVLICDEVTSALDVSVQAAIVELLHSLLTDGLTIVFVTHNLAVVRSIADSVVVLSRGRVVEQGRTGDVLGAPRHAYTRGLLADTLEIDAGVVSRE